MNEVIAEFRIYNMFVAFIHVCKLPREYKSSKVRRAGKTEDYSSLLLDQGFVWYQDFMAFYMLSDYCSYSIKIAVKDCLELDSVIANARGGRASAIVLPFQITLKSY